MIANVAPAEPAPPKPCGATVSPRNAFFTVTTPSIGA